MATTTKTKKSVSAKACANCAHYQAAASAAGECRRHAPQTVAFEVDDEVTFVTRFPSVKAEDWCGEFVKAKS